MRKKITSILLVLTMIFGMMSSALPVFAEGEVSYTKVISIEAGKTYVIVASGMGMTATTNNGYVNNSGSYQYSGFSGTSVTVASDKITSTVTEDMLWEAETSGSGFAFKNVSKGQYLNAFYNGGNANNGLRFGESPETWTFNGSTLKHESTSSSSGKAKYLAWDTTSDVSGGIKSGNADLFTIRSTGDTVTLYVVNGDVTDVPGGDVEEPPVTPDPDAVNGTFTKVSSIENGKTYVITAEGMGMTATPHSGYKNGSGYEYSGFAGIAVTVADDKITSDVTEDMLWTAEAVSGGFAFKNASNNQYLNATYYKNGDSKKGGFIECGDSAAAWTLENDSKLKNVDISKYLTWEKESDISNGHDSGSANLFSIRSTGDTVTLYLAEIEVECQHDWVNATCTAAKTCTVCNATEGEALGHDWAEATCNDPKTCKRENCDVTEGDALGHSFTNYTSNNDATCTSDGTKTAICDNAGCEESETVTDTDSKLGHDWAETLNKDADGHWYDCTRCDEINGYEAHEFDANSTCECGYIYNHVHELTLVEANAATCEEDGNTAYYTCSGCDDYFEDADGLVIITNKNSVVIAHPGHSFTNYVSNNNATCTADGTKTATCDNENCDKTDTKVDDGSATGHSFTNYSSNGDATCTTDGTKTATCDNSNCEETKTIADEGSATGHSFTSYTFNNDATCDADGTKTATCDNADCTETETITAEGSAIGHNFANYVPNNDATCTEDGTKTAICSNENCGEINTITDEGSATGHSFTNYTYNNDATCEEDGTKTAKCDNCNSKSTTAAAETALGHDFADATCTAPKTCKREGCNATEGAELGHNWNTPATGEATICERCGLTDWPSVQLIVTADKTDANPGDTITYTVALSAVENIAGIQFDMVIPEGLTYVSGALADGLQTKLGASVCGFNADLVRVVIGGMDYTSTAATTILTFTCTVNKGFEGEIDMDVDTENWYFESASDVIEITLNNTNATVDVECEHKSYVNVVADKYLKSAATCENKAVYYKSCEFCFVASTTATFENGDALGHNYGEWVTVTAATCEEDGLEKRTCTNDTNHTEENVLTKLGHDWADATCTAPQTCKRDNCDATQGEELGHVTVVDAAVAPKCEQTGLTEGSHCSRCNEILVAQETVDALEHVWSDATDVLPEICSLCDMTRNVTVDIIITADKSEAVIGDAITYTVSFGPVYKLADIEFTLDIPEGLTFVSADLADGLAQLLGAEECYFDADELKLVIRGMEYTSAENTTVLTFTCTVDEAFFGNLLMGVDALTVEDKNHEVETVLVNEDSAVYVACTHPASTVYEFVASTCTVPGHDVYKACDMCGEVLEGSNAPLELDPENHYNAVTYAAVPGTCQLKGHAEYTKCEDCGVIIEGSDEPTVDPHGNSRSTDEAYLKSAADCYNSAVYYMYCSECGEINTTATFVSGSPLEHVATEATCTDPSVCTLCDTVLADALGHDWIDATYDEPKTCNRCNITEGEALTGFTVSGTVTSFDSETNMVTINLYDSEGNVVYTTTVYGNNAEYAIPGVKPGTYTLTISKNYHVTRSYSVTVDEENIALDVMIILLGDVNADGKISLIDCNMVYNHINETAIIADEYAFMCADVNSDGNLDNDDYDMLYNYLLGL